MSMLDISEMSLLPWYTSSKVCVWAFVIFFSSFSLAPTELWCRVSNLSQWQICSFLNIFLWPMYLKECLMK